MNKLNDVIVASGYKNWNNESDGFGVRSFYQKRLDNKAGFSSLIPLCNLNEKLLINIEWSIFSINGIESCSYMMSLVHENQDGEWCDIRIYSLTEKQLEANIHKYEDKLIRMWKEFN